MANQFNHRVNTTAASVSPLDTLTCFNVSYKDSSRSPIDNCFDKIDNLNLIHVRFNSIVGLTKDLIETQNNLILLGYISALESYLREVIRKIIIIDPHARISCEEVPLNYGAAINHSPEMLPEALLEKISFASKKNIVDAIKTFLGFSGHMPDELIKVLDEFEKICHLRHCVVHRFGKLGSNNAIKFGLDIHSNCLEKPLSLDTAKLFEINQICENSVLVINDFLFKYILQRTVDKNNPNWFWDFRKDKAKYKSYYELFTSVKKPSVGSSLLHSYNDLKVYKFSQK